MQEENSRSPFHGLKLAVLKDGDARWTGRIAPASEAKWTDFFRQRKPTLVFLDSMSDLFHEDLPETLILHWLRTVRRAHWHTFEVLTKRHGRMAKVMARLCERNGELHLADAEVPWEERPEIPNLWLGTTVEDQRAADLAIPFLLKVKASVRFLSMEPLMERVDLGQYLGGIHWVIVGGESGSGWRPMALDWVRSLRDQTVEARVVFFLKQEAGSAPPLLPELDGKRWPWLPRRPRLPCPTNTERQRLLAWAEEGYAKVILPAFPQHGRR